MTSAQNWVSGAAAFTCCLITSIGVSKRGLCGAIGAMSSRRPGRHTCAVFTTKLWCPVESSRTNGILPLLYIFSYGQSIQLTRPSSYYVTEIVPVALNIYMLLGARMYRQVSTLHKPEMFLFPHAPHVRQRRKFTRKGSHTDMDLCIIVGFFFNPAQINAATHTVGIVSACQERLPSTDVVRMCVNDIYDLCMFSGRNASHYRADRKTLSRGQWGYVLLLVCVCYPTEKKTHQWKNTSVSQAWNFIILGARLHSLQQACQTIKAISE